MDKLQVIFEQMTDEQKKEFIDTINRYHLAISINADPVFITESVEDLLKKYPFISECMDELHQTSPKRT